MGRTREGDISSNGAKKRQLERVYKKYKGICQLCFKSCPRDQASRDHVVELSKGGSAEDFNVVLAHKDCNNEKSNGKSVHNYTAAIPNGKTAATILPEWWEKTIANQIKGCLIRQAAGLVPTGPVLQRLRGDTDFRSVLCESD